MEIQEIEIQRLKGDFHRWLNDWDAVSNPDAMLNKLSICIDRLPRDFCTAFDLPLESNYGDAADLFLSSWLPGEAAREP